MQRTSVWVGGLLFLALCFPALGSDNKPDDTSKRPAPARTKPENKSAEKPKPFTYSIKFPAKLLRFEPAKHILSVEITYKVPQNSGGARKQRQLLTARFKDVTKKIDLEPADELKVRTRLLPLETDDKGKPRRLSEQEKRELKGPDYKLPGYTADPDSLRPNQQIEVYLEKPSRNGSRQKLSDLTETTKKKPKAVMLVIVAEPRK